jgi:hypothetical protein
LRFLVGLNLFFGLRGDLVILLMLEEQMFYFYLEG